MKEEYDFSALEEWAKINKDRVLAYLKAKRKWKTIDLSSASKKCPCCGFVKPYTSFTPDAYGSYEVSYYCTDCESRSDIPLRKDDTPYQKRMRERAKKYYQENKQKCHAHSAFRKMLRSLRVPKWANEKKIAHVYEDARMLSKRTGVQYHVDHVVPLRGRLVSGLHVENNLRIVKAKENLRKSNKFVVA